jgi:hypothetical protein
MNLFELYPYPVPGTTPGEPSTPLSNAQGSTPAASSVPASSAPSEDSGKESPINYGDQLRKEEQEAAQEAETARKSINDYIAENPRSPVAEAYMKMAEEQDNRYKKAQKAYNARVGMAGLADFIGILSRMHAASQSARIDPLSSQVKKFTQDMDDQLAKYGKAGDIYREKAALQQANDAIGQEERTYNFLLNQYKQALERADAARSARNGWEKEEAKDERARKLAEWKALDLPVKVWNDPGQIKMRQEKQDEAVRETARKEAVRARRKGSTSRSGGGGTSSYDILTRPGGLYSREGNIIVPRTAKADNALIAAAQWALKQYPAFTPVRSKSGAGGGAEKTYRDLPPRDRAEALDLLAQTLKKLEETNRGKERVRPDGRKQYQVNYNKELYDLTEMLRNAGALFVDPEGNEIKETRFNPSNYIPVGKNGDLARRWKDASQTNTKETETTDW